jgi:hypothetical protein
MKGFGPDWTSWDDVEEDRLEKLEAYESLVLSTWSHIDSFQTERPWQGPTAEETWTSRFVFSA